mmetsp:Transcript_52538/g.151423  ORF Transcript_52538/g.151423 Transcript_52538/m.151423 type:complete len:255 (-) Transcript_52538:409-1173(-)
MRRKPPASGTRMPQKRPPEVCAALGVQSKIATPLVPSAAFWGKNPRCTIVEKENTIGIFARISTINAGAKSDQCAMHSFTHGSQFNCRSASCISAKPSSIVPRNSDLDTVTNVPSPVHRNQTCKWMSPPRARCSYQSSPDGGTTKRSLKPLRYGTACRNQRSSTPSSSRGWASNKHADLASANASAVRPSRTSRDTSRALAECGGGCSSPTARRKAVPNCASGEGARRQAPAEGAPLLPRPPCARTLEGEALPS